MRLPILGAGGVGSAAALIAARRPFLSGVVVADYDVARAQRAVSAAHDPRFVAARLDASDEPAMEALIADERIDAVLGATDPRFTMPSSGRRWRPGFTTLTWRCHCRVRTPPIRTRGPA